MTIIEIRPFRNGWQVMVLHSSVKRFCQPSDRWRFQPRIQWKDMTSDEYEKLPAADREHFMQCPHCGEMLSLEDVFLHVADKRLPNIPYSGSTKL